jgi:hypothetical protein
MNDLYVRLKKTGRSPMVTCLNVLRNMNRGVLGLYWLYLMHEPLFIIPIVVLGHGVGGDKSS